MNIINKIKQYISENSSNYTYYDFISTFKENNVQKFSTVLKQYDKNDLNEQNKYGHTLVHIFFTSENIEFIKILLNDIRIDCDIQDYKGITTLHIAILKNNIEITNLLLNDKRINPNK